MNAAVEAAPSLQLACLCAAWCRLCDAYAPVIEQVAAELAAEGLLLSTRWIDIEDEAELVGDYDVETFPTLLLLDERQLRFAGPVTPQPETLRRLLRALAAGAGQPAAGVPVAAEGLAQRLREQRLA